MNDRRSTERRVHEQQNRRAREQRITELLKENVQLRSDKALLVITVWLLLGVLVTAGWGNNHIQQAHSKTSEVRHG